MERPVKNMIKLKMPSPALAKTNPAYICEFFPDCITEAAVKRAL